MMKHLQTILLWLVAPLILMTGCIKEDLDDCGSKISLSLEYLADGSTNVWQQYIHQVDLYVFNVSNQLVDKKSYDQNALLDTQCVLPSFNLPAGTYHIEIVGNVGSMTSVVGLESGEMSEIFIQHPAWGTSGKVTGHDHNYLGYKKITVPGKGESYEDTVRLYSAHINVEVSIRGLGTTGESGRIPYSLCFEQSNAQTNFLNEIHEGETGTCHVPLVYDSSLEMYHTKDLALFRMDGKGLTEDNRCCQHILKLFDADGGVMVLLDIADYLEKHSPSIDITRQEAVLPIEIVFTPVSVEVRLPQWYIEDINPDWE